MTLNPVELSRRHILGLATGLVWSQTSSDLPIRPIANKSFPELCKRWNAMFTDKTPKNLEGQLALHGEMCDFTKDCLTGATIPDVHHSPDFVLWHRAFLYYHEKILSALGSGPVGLPYWDWSSIPMCPPAYQAVGFCFADHLERSENALGADNFSKDQVAAVVYALQQLRPEEAAQDLFDEPIHSVVHNRFGWDRFTDITSAAGDPLFYGHHGNLDRLASHIFKNGWPAPSGNHYHFIDSDAAGSTICTALDRFASMPSMYDGDQPVDTTGFQVLAVENLGLLRSSSYIRVRTKISFEQPISRGLHHLFSGKGDQLGEIASITHGGSRRFIVWLTLDGYHEATRSKIIVEVENRRFVATIGPKMFVNKI